MTTMPTSPVATSCAEARYDCGHITRSSSRPVKRALFLFLAEGTDLGYLGGRTEPVEVLAALTLMRAGAECGEILRAGEGAVHFDAVADSLEEAISPTSTQCEVLVLVSEGYSYPEIALATRRNVETVRSLVKAAMARTRTHSAMDAAVMAALLGAI